MRTVSLLVLSLVAVACADPVVDATAAPLQPPSAPAPAPDRDTHGGVTARVTPLPAAALIEDERNTIAVFEAAQAATVYVTQKQVVRDWGRRLVEVPSGSGTGFLWDGDGHVVTNAHVVQGGRSFTVTLHDGSSHEARLVGVEPLKDIAVLKIDAETPLTAIRLPPAGDPLYVGQKAVAIGNPFGLDHTLTVGVISALGRDVEGFGGVTIRDMVQTDASINPGNSGGPLLDSRGQLIGMNTMIFSGSGSSAGIGFAVPTQHIRRIVPQIIEHGRPLRVGLGVELVPDQALRRQGLKGVGIRAVTPDSPAAEAGLRGLRQGRYGWLLGDVIVAIDNEGIEDFDDLYNVLDTRRPGESVRVTVLREGRHEQVDVELTVLKAPAVANPGRPQ